jgi:beta-lactam-binding protein with PASTA domain
MIRPLHHHATLSAIGIALSLICLLPGRASSAAKPDSPASKASKRVSVSYGKLPLSFEPNLGQTAKEVQWLARGPEYTLYLTGPDAVLQLNAILPAAKPGEPLTINSSALRMNLLGAKAAEREGGEEPEQGKANYFTGNDPTKWQRDVPMYAKVHMQGVYPGVDLKYYGHRGELEYDFVVSPGADASAIRLRFDGAKPTLAANGDLVLPVEGGPEVRFDKPVIYQWKDGVRQPVDGSFVVADNHQVSFKLGAYDHSRELTIDPTLLFLGTLGTGNQQSVPNGMAVDVAGEIILTGITNDLTFPTTADALQPICTNSSAIFNANYHRCGPSSASSGFVTKISADGTELIYSTYLHGLSGQEYGDAVAADTSGDAYILGMTSSNDFPITGDAIQTLCQPVYATTLLGVPTGSAFASCDGNFAGGGTEFVYQGPTLFIAKLDPTGSTLLYSTFFGGTIPTYPVALALDSSNNIYFASYLQNAEPANDVYPSAGAIAFPVTSSAYQSSGVGVQSATLSKLSADGHTLLYSTLMGGITTNTFFGYTQPLALAVGQNGLAYIGGITLTSEFPTTLGAVKPNCVGNTPDNGDCIGYTAFLSAFDTTQSGSASLAYSTYIGGTETAAGNTVQNQVNGLIADSFNNVYVAGSTTRIDYPTTAGAYQTTCGHFNAGNTCSAAFLSKINPTGTGYIWSTYFGGTSANPAPATGNAVALDAQGLVYLYGMSQDGGGDIPTVNPLQAYFGGNKLFIAAFSPDASTLLFGTRLGNTSTTTTSSEDPIANNGIGVDAEGNIYFAGQTNDNGSMPTTPGTYATTATAGFNRGFFGKISPVLAANTTALTISPSTANVGQSVTFSVQVSGTIQTTPVPTGTVTLTNLDTSPSTVLGTITLGATGAGTFSTSTLPAGTYSVTASYSGDDTYDVSTSSAMPLTITTPAQVLVPNVVGLTQNAATTSITGAGLVVGTVSTASSSTVPSGSVISESPLAGTSVAVGSSVSLTVSTGPATVLVPNVVGLTQTAATTSITGAGLVVGTVSTGSSSTVPSGSVISEAPLAGTSVAVGSSVNLVVSTGPATVLVPNVVGLTQTAASTSIRGAGLVVGTVSTGSNSTVPSGSVISEAPLAGTSVAVGSSVNLVVSTGPAPTSNFTITVIPPAETVNRGVLGGFILELNSVKGFDGNVKLSCSGGPAGSECADLPQTVKVNGTAYALSGILFPKNATPGTYTITFIGVSGSLTNSATAKFTVK